MSWEYLSKLLRRVMVEYYGGLDNPVRLKFHKNWVILTLTDPVSGNLVNQWSNSEDEAKNDLIDKILQWKK